MADSELNGNFKRKQKYDFRHKTMTWATDYDD